MPKCHYGKARCIRGAQTAWAGGLRWNNDNALHSKSTDVPFNTRFQSDRTPFLHRVNKTCTHRLSRHTPFVYMCILYRKRKWAIQNATSTLSDKRGRHRRVLKKKTILGRLYTWQVYSQSLKSSTHPDLCSMNVPMCQFSRFAYPLLLSAGLFDYKTSFNATFPRQRFILGTTAPEKQ